MALVKWGLPASVSGKIGGVVALITGVLRIWAKPVNPQTQSQQNQRGILTGLAQAWRGLTEPQRASWQGLTAEVPRSNRIGDTITLSGNALYNAFNAILALFGVAANASAPVLTSLEQLTTLSFVADASAHTLVISADFGATIANTGAIIEATPQMSAGRYFAKNQFRVLSTEMDIEDVDTLDVGSLYEAAFGTLTTGKKIFIRVTPAQVVTGQIGIPFEASSIVVA